jgi:hypothetical protein
MSPQNAARPATERTVNEPQVSSSGGVDVPTNKRSLSEYQAKVLVRLHRLGPSPLGADVAARLERYAEIEPELVRMLGGHKFQPFLHVVDGGSA